MVRPRFAWRIAAPFRIDKPMIGMFRRFLETRVARLFFVVLIIPFVMWGVADMARNFGSDTSLANVGGRKIEPGAFQDAFRAQMQNVTRMMGGQTEPTPEIRREVAGQTLDRLIVQAAIANQVAAMGVVVPDAALRQAVFAMPAFQNKGAFDKARFEQVLQQNNFTEGRFLELMRSDLATRQVMDAVQVGVAAPAVLVNQVFAFQHETRVADMVELPLTAAPTPPTPTDADLKDAYENDPSRYSAPAYRHIQAVVLSPETLAKGINVSDADIKAYYDAHKDSYGQAAKRSIEVLVAQSEAAAKALAATWSGGADWAAMQKAAAAAGASAASLDDVLQTDIPGTELGQAAFKAQAGAVVGPIKSTFGWQLVKVTKVNAGSEKTLAEVQGEIKATLAQQRATDAVYDRANKLQDVLSAGNTVEQIPADIGATVFGGSLDAKGNTKTGEPAPIPGSPALRQAIVTAAFAAQKNQPLDMVEGPDHSYYALTVTDETPAQVRPFAEVQGQVRDNWLQDWRRHAQNEVAARLMSAVNAGGSLDDAATVAGLRVETTKPIGRGAAPDGVPTQLVDPLFGLQAGHATMVETPEGFVVAQLKSVTAPPPSSDPLGAAQMRVALDHQLQGDVELIYANALRVRNKPTVNRALLESLTQ